MSGKTTDCIVVGAGLIGMLTARELRAAGASVAVFDRGLCGQEASWAGGGILSPLYPWRYPRAVTALAAWGQCAYPDLATALTEESGVDPEWTRSGMLILDVADQEAALAWAERHAVRMESIEPRQWLGIEPVLSCSESDALGDSALWLPDIAQVRNPRLVRALRESLIKQGVRLQEGVEVQSLVKVGNRIAGVQTNQGVRRAGAVVVAGGAWSAGLLRTVGIGLPLAPVRGQMILFQAPVGLLTRMVMRHHRYLIPRRDGRILAGSTLEQLGFDKATTQAAAAELRRAAVDLVPSLEDCPVERQWAGLRPGNPSGVPYIGPHPSMNGLYICTGHYRNGVVLAPASARLLTDSVLGRTPILDLSPYAPPAAV
jgi:glycine oxidase